MISTRKPFLTFLEAFDIVGRKKFGDEWIGNDGGEASEARAGRRASPEDAKAFARTHPGEVKVPWPDPDTKEYREQYEAWCRREVAVTNLQEVMADFYVKSTYREDGTDDPVEPANWDLRNEYCSSSHLNSLDDSFDPRGASYRGELRIDREGFLEAILAAFPEDEGLQQKSSIRAETLCKKWLVSLMEEEGPPDMSKSDYLADAKEQFGTGVRSFKRAWSAAVNESGNTAWSAPGRKSVRRIDTPIAS